MNPRTILASLAVGCFCSLAAGQINVVNFDFEDPVMQPNGFTNAQCPGWASVGGSGDWGVFYPTIATWSYVTSRGHQLFYTNGTTAEQVLAYNAAAGESYTLLIDVINRPVYGGNDYFIELRAGNTVLARDDNTLHPPVGGYLTASLSYTVAPGDPVIGQPLTIRLGGANQTNFDYVRLVLGDGCWTCVADFNNSGGTPDDADIAAFFLAWNNGDNCADANGSGGTPDDADIAQFFALWNSGGC